LTEITTPATCLHEEIKPTNDADEVRAEPKDPRVVIPTVGNCNGECSRGMFNANCEWSTTNSKWSITRGLSRSVGQSDGPVLGGIKQTTFVCQSGASLGRLCGRKDNVAVIACQRQYGHPWSKCGIGFSRWLKALPEFVRSVILLITFRNGGRCYRWSRPRMVAWDYFAFVYNSSLTEVSVNGPWC